MNSWRKQMQAEGFVIIMIVQLYKPITGQQFKQWAYSLLICLVQLQLGTEVLHTPISTQLRFKLNS